MPEKDDWYNDTAQYGIGGPPSLIWIVRSMLAVVMLVTIGLSAWIAPYAFTVYPLLALPLGVLVILCGSAAHMLIHMA